MNKNPRQELIIETINLIGMLKDIMGYSSLVTISKQLEELITTNLAKMKGASE